MCVCLCVRVCVCAVVDELARVVLDAHARFLDHGGFFQEELAEAVLKVKVSLIPRLMMRVS